MGRYRRIARVLSLLALAWTFPVTALESKTKPISLPGYDYVLHVPDSWERISKVEGSMLLHLKAGPNLNRAACRRSG